MRRWCRPPTADDNETKAATDSKELSVLRARVAESERAPLAGGLVDLLRTPPPELRRVVEEMSEGCQRD